MNILPSSESGSVGAVALLGHADSIELDRFNSLEDAVWTLTTLPPAVIESVRLRCAHIRRCASCSAVRFSAASDDGLSESQIALLDSPSDRDRFSEAQQSALALVERFLLNPGTPPEEERQRIASALGTAGVMEVLMACATFSSSELRLALGEDPAAESNIVVERDRVEARKRPSATYWPALTSSVLDPDFAFPEVEPRFADLVRGRISTLRSNRDLPAKLFAACVIRSMQLHRVDPEDSVAGYLAPPDVVLPDAGQVRDWPNWPPGIERGVLGLAEQLWLDPSRVDETIVNSLRKEMGVDAIIRITWALIWLGQLHRLALVLQRGYDG